MRGYAAYLETINRKGLVRAETVLVDSASVTKISEGFTQRPLLSLVTPATPMP